MKICEILKPGAVATRNYAEKILKDIPANQFARKAVVNGVRIELNHPAFGIGHLALYPVQLAKMVGLDPSLMTIPEKYPSLFQQNTECVDDVDGTFYPSMQELTENFFRSTDALLKSFADIDESRFHDRLEDPRRQDRFGCVGAFFAYVMLAHPQNHLAQVLGWRKCMGLGAG